MFPDGYVISGFSSNILKLTWVLWKLFNNFNEIKYEYPWIKVTKFMTGQRWIPSKIKPRSPNVSIEPTIEWKLIIEAKEKPYRPSVSMVWWHGYRDYRGFSKQSDWRCCPKMLFILTKWGTGKKMMLIEGCWWTSSTLLPIDNLLRDFKIELMLSF